MSVQDIQMVPPMISRVRSSGGRKASGESPAAMELVASAALTLTLVPVFLYSGLAIAVTIPLALLIGCISQHLFRLMFRPTSTDVFSPTTLVVGYFAVDIAARSFFLCTVPFFARVGRNPYDDYIPAALWCASAGYVSYLAGSESKIARTWLRRLPSGSQFWPKSVPALRVLAMMAMGLASLIYLFKHGMAVGNYGNKEFQRQPPPGAIVLLENLINMSWVAICVFLVTSKQKAARSLAWLLLGISVCLLFLKLAISGGKVALIQPFLEAAIVFHYGKRRFRIWELLIVGVPVIMMAFGVVNFYRFVVVGHHGSPKSIADVVSRISSTSDLLKAEGGTGNQQSALEQLVARDAGTDALALIMKYTPHPFPFQYGVHWLEVPLSFFPRQFWKDKPVNMPSAEFESTYMGMPRSFNGFSSMHMMGDLYRNFSFPGVLLGMFLLGVLLRFFYLFGSPSRENGAGLFLFATVFPEIIHSLESDVGFAAINVSRAAGLAIIVAITLGARFRKFRRVKSAPGPRVVTGRPGFLVTPTAESRLSGRGTIWEAPIES